MNGRCDEQANECEGHAAFLGDMTESYEVGESRKPTSWD
jgi:hypothetical protein